MKRRTRTRIARTAAAGLVLIAATAMAAPGWAHEPKQEQRRGRERDQCIEKRQKEKREHRLDRRNPATRAVRTIARKLRLTREQRRSLLELVRATSSEVRDRLRTLSARWEKKRGRRHMRIERWGGD